MEIVRFKRFCFKLLRVLNQATNAAEQTITTADNTGKGDLKTAAGDMQLNIN